VLLRLFSSVLHVLRLPVHQVAPGSACEPGGILRRSLDDLTLFGTLFSPNAYLCHKFPAHDDMYENSQPDTESIHQLLPAEGSIRLLDLQSGEGLATLRASLRIANVDDPRTKYEALSYTWGSSTKGHSIRINGSNHNTSITDNLYSALRRLRKNSRDPDAMGRRNMCVDD